MAQWSALLLHFFGVFEFVCFPRVYVDFLRVLRLPKTHPCSIITPATALDRKTWFRSPGAALRLPTAPSVLVMVSMQRSQFVVQQR